MAQAPVMPVFTDALIADTEHLTAEQCGAYFRILLATWRNNGVALPHDDKRMARICKVSVSRWRKILSPVIAEFFTVDQTGWHQKRLEKEFKKLLHWRQNSERGGRANAFKYQKTGGAKSGAKTEPSDSPPPGLPPILYPYPLNPLTPLKRGLDEIEKGEKVNENQPLNPRALGAGPRRNGALPEHRATYGPLRDPTEIARERGLRK